MSHFLRPIFALSFAAFMVASGLSSDAAPAERQRSASFDGLWSVVIVTLRGSCDRSYRYPVRIVGNRVLQAGADPSYRLYGAVSRSGAPASGRPSGAVDRSGAAPGRARRASLPVALVRRGRLRSCGKGGRRTYRLYDHLRCRRSGSCASSAHYRSPSHHLPSGAASATRTRSGASPPTSPSCRRYSRSSVLGIFGVRRFGLKPRSESCAKT
jgi:hypothetical protein